MKNKKGKSFLGMLLLLIAIGVFGYFGYSTMNQIKLGLDLAGGVSITYQAKPRRRFTRRVITVST